MDREITPETYIGRKYEFISGTYKSIITLLQVSTTEPDKLEIYLQIYYSDKLFTEGKTTLPIASLPMLTSGYREIKNK